MADKILDSVIIGTGPAGLSAAVYAERAGLDFRIFEKFPMSGGQIVNTGEVENYLGFSSIGGFELSQRFYEHSLAVGVKIENAEITAVKKNEGIFEIESLSGESFYSKTVIAATGAVSKKLNVPGEAEFTGKGVSYCAHCDGAFYKGKKAAVIGGGDTAVCDAIYLSNICSKVYVIIRRDAFRAAESLVKKLKSLSNVQIIQNSIIKEIKGQQKLTSIVLENVSDKKETTLDADGVFIAVGITPVSELFKDTAKTDRAGFICADEDCKTSLSGLFAAGDVRTKPLRQIVTAVADGANAVYSAEKYIREM
ncbi:MAG: thioredoxin-disulfide reductase [Ruminococcus sp.]